MSKPAVEVTRADLVRELAGTRCRCGSSKTAKRTFCSRCYYSLPISNRNAIYRRIGRGYEEAYLEAVELLNLS